MRSDGAGRQRDAMMAEFFDLSGQIALVTGAGRGIGAGIAARLARAGARVAIFDASPEAAESAACEVGGIALSGDVRSEADVAAAIAGVESALGPLSILVNNAGITGRTDLSWNLSVDEVRTTNYRNYALASCAARLDKRSADRRLFIGDSALPSDAPSRRSRPNAQESGGGGRRAKDRGART